MLLAWLCSARRWQVGSQAGSGICRDRGAALLRALWCCTALAEPVVGLWNATHPLSYHSSPM
jgi:hypothetical protein